MTGRKCFETLHELLSANKSGNGEGVAGELIQKPGDEVLRMEGLCQAVTSTSKLMEAMLVVVGNDQQ